jgi:hypothetical protein
LSDTPAPIREYAAHVIPFRFVDGIMKRCQRYFTHG